MAKKLILSPILARLAQMTHKTSSRLLVVRHRLLQFKQKLINQTWYGKKPNFGPGFGTFDPNLGLQFFFRGFYLY